MSIQRMQICQGPVEHGFWVDIPQLVVETNQCWLITGASGSGKSTLLEVIGLLKACVTAQEFHYFFRQDNWVDAQSLWQNNLGSELAGLRARTIGFVLQTGGLLPYLSVQDNIYLPLCLLGHKPADDFVSYAINVLQLDPLLNQKPHQLSIGERQRVAFVRAIAHRPQLLLADEPTAALDPHNAQRLLALIHELQQHAKLSVVLVTHNPGLVKWPELRQLHAEAWQSSGTPQISGSRFVA